MDNQLTLDDRIEQLVKLVVENESKVDTNVLRPTIRHWSKMYNKKPDEIFMKYLGVYCNKIQEVNLPILPLYNKVDVGLKNDYDKLEYSKL